MKQVDPDLINQLSGLPKDFLATLKQAACKPNIGRIAIIGGVIRDHLIHKIHNEPLNKLRDIDLIVEGSVESLANYLEISFGAERVVILSQYSSYQTIQLKIDNLTIDLARARGEVYKLPGDNPKVFNSNIEKDLERRDFSINSIALEIINNNIIDIHNGCEAIYNRQLKLLHSKSIYDDPTRIIRGARYASRLGFDLDSSSVNQIQSTLHLWPWDWKLNDPPEKAPSALSSRLKMELELLFKTEDWRKAIIKLQGWGALDLIDRSLQKDKYWERRVTWLSKYGVEALTAFIAASKNPTLLAKRLQLNHENVKIFMQLEEIKSYTYELIKSKASLNLLPSIWTSEIESRSWSPASVAIAISLGIPTWKPFLKWLKKWRLVKPKITAVQLLAEGWEPGAKLGKELKKLRAIQLDKDI